MIEIITVSSHFFFFGLHTYITANTHYAISKMTLLEYSLTTPHDKKVLFGTLSFWHMVCKSMNFYLVSIQKRPSLTKWWWSSVCSKWRFLWQARLLKWWNRWNSSKNLFFLHFCHPNYFVYISRKYTKNAEIQFMNVAVIRCNYSKDVSILAIYLDISFIKGVN